MLRYYSWVSWGNHPYSPKLKLIEWIGAGESGKSTILKQMRLIYTDGFGIPERKEVRQVIFSNMVVAFKIIGEEMRDLGMEYGMDTSLVCHWDWMGPELAAKGVLEIRSNHREPGRYRSWGKFPCRVSRSYESALARPFGTTHHESRQRIRVARQYFIVY